MKIACIGTGFVGVVTAAVFTKLGHDVVGLDIDEQKIASLQAGHVPFFEPQLEELLQEGINSGKLTFTTSYQEAVTDAEVILVMVGTPSAPDGTADLKYVFASAKSLAPHLKSGAVIVLKSTVPPGTNEKVRDYVSALTKVKFDVASVPEFLREGSAVADTLHPDRVLIGSNRNETVKLLTALHEPLTSNVIVMKPESAQMAKYAGNVYLAMRITFANQIANLCEKNGADIEEVLRGIGADQRIGSHYWYPGLGYGGSCFPKDVREIAAYAKSIGEHDSIFIAVDELNHKRIPTLMEKYDKQIGGFAGKTIAILGLSFKPRTNDTRESPASYVIPWLKDKGATVRTADPQVTADFTDPYEAVKGAHALFLLVEWPQFIGLDLARVASLMSAPKHIFDTRNQYQPKVVELAGMIYHGVGR